MDQWQAWYGGTTFTLPFTSKAVEASKSHRLVLDPEKK
jgi:penicillin amidase